MNTSPRIHICYSDRHFHPEKMNREKYWFSCAQIAMHLLNALNAEFSHVTYGDDIPKEPIDLLLTNQCNKWNRSVKRMIYFASIGHYAYVREQINKYVQFADSHPVEGKYVLRDLWSLWATLARSSAIMIIGNKNIFDSFRKHTSPFVSKCMLLNYGIDRGHFNCANFADKKRQFVYNATRFSIRKGSHIVYEAWRKACQNFPDDVRLVVLGRNGDYDLKSRLSAFSNVDFLGPYESGSSFYISNLTASRWAINASIAEGQAGTLLEALSCGCVPLASLDSGINADEYGGYVLEPNTPENLSNLMIKAANEMDAERFLRVCDIVRKKHNWDDFEVKVRSLTREVLNAPPANQPNRLNLISKFCFSGQLRSLIG